MANEEYNYRMVPAAILASLFLHGPAPVQPVGAASMWEEPPIMQKIKGYHPMLRFGCWDIIRFNRATTYMFLTPDYVQQGQYQQNDSDYTFRAVMANELENSDLRNLLEGVDAPSGRELGKKYANSMANFEGSYNEITGALSITYPVEGRPRTFQLYRTNAGDDQLQVTVSDAARGLIGLWHTPDPFPEKLDARTRFKIGGLDGLQRFANEAQASNASQFGVLDLRADGTFRSHSVVGTWMRNGSVVTLRGDGKPIELTVSADGMKLLAQGKPAYLRN